MSSYHESNASVLDVSCSSDVVVPKSWFPNPDLGNSSCLSFGPRNGGNVTASKSLTEAVNAVGDDLQVLLSRGSPQVSDPVVRCSPGIVLPKSWVPDPEFRSVHAEACEVGPVGVDVAGKFANVKMVDAGLPKMGLMCASSTDAGSDVISDDGGTSNIVTTFDDAVMVSIPPIQPIPTHGRYVSASILLNRPAAPKFGRQYLVRSNGHVRGVPDKGPSWTSIIDANSGDDGFVVTTAAFGVIPVVVDGVNDAGQPKFISYLAEKYRKADFAGSRVLKKGPSRGWVTKNSSRADSCNSYTDLHVSVQTVTSFRLGSGLVELVLPHIRADLATAALLDLARAVSEVMPKSWVLVPVWYYLVLI